MASLINFINMENTEQFDPSVFIGRHYWTVCDRYKNELINNNDNDKIN